MVKSPVDGTAVAELMGTKALTKSAKIAAKEGRNSVFKRVLSFLSPRLTSGSVPVCL